MRKITWVVGLVLAGALLLSGCELPEFLHMKGVNWNRLTLDPSEFSEPSPSPSPTPVPTQKPVPEGAAGELWALYSALLDNDYTAVAAICPDGLPGYTDETTQRSAILQQLYRAAYDPLTLRLGSASEGNADAVVTAEFTTRDLRGVLAAFTADAQAWAQGEGAAAPHEERLAQYETLLRAQLDEPGDTVTRRVSVTLRKESGHWIVCANNELRNALTGGLFNALQDFDLPADAREAPAQEDEGGGTYKPLMANGYGSVVVSALYPNDPEGYVMELTIQNSCGSALVYSLRDARLNGFVMDPQWCVNVEAGGSLVTRVVWDRAALAACGITRVTNIRFRLDVFEKPAWPVYPLLRINCTVYPAGGNDAVSPKPPAEHEQMLQDDGVTYVSLLSAHADGCWGYTLTLYLENNSDQELWFAFDDTRLNSQDADPGWSQTLPPGARAVETVRWTAGELITRGIGTVERVDFRLSISTLVGLDETELSYASGGRMTLSGDGSRLS